jgi:hypothetical protein
MTLPHDPAPPARAWWEVANSGFRPVALRSADESDDVAIEAARHGSFLELRDVSFSYPVRPDVPVLSGVSLKLPR